MSDLVHFRSANHWLSDERKGKFKKWTHERQRSMGKNWVGSGKRTLKKWASAQLCKPLVLIASYCVGTSTVQQIGRETKEKSAEVGVYVKSGDPLPELAAMKKLEQNSASVMNECIWINLYECTENNEEN